MKKNIFTIAIIAIIFVFTSCDKEEEVTINQPQASATKDILTFATQEEFDKTLAKVNAMTKEERLTWEKEQGFKSFGTICDDYYYSLDFSEYQSIEKLKMNTNNKLLKIYEEDGDFYIEPCEFSSKFKYIINKDKMYIISNRIFKIVESKPISTNLSDYNLLMSIEDYNSFKIIFEKKYQTNSLKAKEREDIEKEITGVSGGKSYKTKVTIQTENFWASFPTRTQIETEFTIKNYKKGLLGFYIDYLYTNYDIELVAYDEVSDTWCNVYGKAENHKIDSYNSSAKVDVSDGWTNAYNPLFYSYKVYVLTHAGEISIKR